VSITILNGYTAWPGLAQVFRLTRERTATSKTTTEVVHGSTSLPRERADARRLLALARQHWGIENRLHYVRDVTLGEDDCRVRSGAAPQALAAIHLLRRLHPRRHRGRDPTPPGQASEGHGVNHLARRELNGPAEAPTRR
jgi:hypothetical protein